MTIAFEAVDETEKKMESKIIWEKKYSLLQLQERNVPGRLEIAL